MEKRRIQKILIDIKKQRSKKLARLEKTGKQDLEKSYITRYVR